MISILLADDDELITMALKTILSPETDFKICATAKTGEETVALYETHRPDVVISDIRMPYHNTRQAVDDHISTSSVNAPTSPTSNNIRSSSHGSRFSHSATPTDNTATLPGGLAAAEQILTKHPDARILLLTTFLDDEYIIRALRLGISGYLLKQDYSALAASVRAVYGGQNVFGNEITQKIPALLAGIKTSDMASDLSEREATLCALIADGLSNREIAEKMFLSEGTVRNYLSTVLEKLQLRDRTQLAIFFLTGKRT